MTVKIAGTFGAENFIPRITTDAYGRVSSVSNTAIGSDPKTGKPIVGNVADAIVERTKAPGFKDMDKYVRQQNIAEVYSSFTEAAKKDLIANSKFSTAIQRRIETAQNRLPRVGKYAK